MMLVRVPCNKISQDRNLFARTRYTMANLFVYSFSHFPNTHPHTNVVSHTLVGICLRDASDPHRYTACVMRADLTTLSTGNDGVYGDHSSAQTQ